MRRAALVVFSLGACALVASCVDLFHGTDFDTLCTHDPGNAACGTDASADAADSSAAPPPPGLDLCSFTPSDAKKLADRACAWLGACEGALGASRFGTCAVQAQLAFDCAANPALRPLGAVETFWRCLAQAKTCADVDTCVFPAGVQPCPAISTGSFTTCGTAGNAAVRVECSSSAQGGRPSAVEPCALTGRSCTRKNDSVAECTAARGTTCVGAPGCDSTSASSCEGSLDHGTDCASYGAGACVGGGACAPPSDAGTCVRAPSGLIPNDTFVCKSGVAHLCITRLDVPTNCAALGLPCDETGASIAVPQSACTSRDDAGAPACIDDACSGSQLTSCGFGVARQLDCTSVGLGPCRMQPNGGAVCTPP